MGAVPPCGIPRPARHSSPPLQVLPELLEVLLLLWPMLMPRAALGRGFALWWVAAHSEKPRASSAAAAIKVADPEEGSKSLAGRSGASLPTCDSAGSQQ